MPTKYEGEENKTLPRTIRFYRGDIELVDQLAKQIGSNRSDVVRTGVRLLAVLLKK